VLIARGQKGADGQTTPTKVITGGAKLDKFQGNYETIDGIKTITCDFSKVVPINKDDDYTSSGTKGKDLNDRQQDPQIEIGTTSIQKTKFKLMGWKLTDKEIQHHDNKEETGTRQAEQKQESRQRELTTETTKETGRAAPNKLAEDNSPGQEPSTPGETTKERRTHRKRKGKGNGHRKETRGRNNARRRKNQTCTKETEEKH
jgi:hypothetical protein